MAFVASRYNYYVKLADKWLVFNTFTTGLFVLDDSYKGRLLAGDLESLKESERAALISKGLIVSEDFDEYALLLFHQLSSMYQSDRCFFEVLPTTGCNAKCFYCFEEGVKPRHMDDATASATARFIVEQSTKSNCRKVHLSWFGGEPLLNTSAIDIVMDYLGARLPDRELYCEMTTNGSLFTDELIKKAATSWSLRKVQITLDGAEDEYAARKRYVNFPSAYDTVLANIEKLAMSGIHVTIRINVDGNNIDSIMRLMDQLKSRFAGYIDKGQISIYGYPLFGCGCHLEPDAKENSSLLIHFTEALVEKGLLAPKKAFGLQRRETQCFARNSLGMLVAPDGAVYKCSQALDIASESIGTVTDGVYTNGAFLKWVSPIIPPECRECIFFPLCLSGCKAGELGYGSVRHYIYHDREVFDNVLRTYARLNRHSNSHFVDENGV